MSRFLERTYVLDHPVNDYLAGYRGLAPRTLDKGQPCRIRDVWCGNDGVWYAEITWPFDGAPDTEQVVPLLDLRPVR